MWRKRSTRALLVGLQINTTALESGMEISQETRKGTTTWPSHPTPWHLSKRSKISKLQCYININVYCNTIHNSRVMETA